MVSDRDRRPAWSAARRRTPPATSGTDSVTVKLDKTAADHHRRDHERHARQQRLVRRPGDGDVHLLRRPVRHRRLPRPGDARPPTAPTSRRPAPRRTRPATSRSATVVGHQHRPGEADADHRGRQRRRAAPTPWAPSRRPPAPPPTASPAWRPARSPSPAATPTAWARSTTRRPRPTRPATPAPVTGTYRVIYRFDGFLQPINDTAHQIGTEHQRVQGRQHRSGEVPAEEGRRHGRPGGHRSGMADPGQGQRDERAGGRDGLQPPRPTAAATSGTTPPLSSTSTTGRRRAPVATTGGSV